MTAEAIPPLPALNISTGTKKKGISQEIADHILRIIYERKPDFFSRTAQREMSKTGGHYDEFIQEFEKFMSELGNQIKEVDLTDSSVWTRVFWEMRRRSRLMYGMYI